jgi:hypothetical protein
MSIIFLFSGQSRCFPFSHNENKSSDILKSYNEFIFTSNFKNKYDYKIYFTTDDLHLENTFSYFGINNIGNIHLLDTNYYLKKINKNIDNLENYFDKYNNKDWTNHAKYDNSIHQHYKLLDCYNLLNEDIYHNDIDIDNCKYIVRLRFDTCFTANILDIISLLENNSKLEIAMCWDLFAIGKPEIMKCYCNGLNNNYGNYNYDIDLSYLEKIPIWDDYLTTGKYQWTYAPERQLFEMIFEYYDKNKKNINDTIMTLERNYCYVIPRV